MVLLPAPTDVFTLSDAFANAFANAFTSAFTDPFTDTLTNDLAFMFKFMVKAPVRADKRHTLPVVRLQLGIGREVVVKRVSASKKLRTPMFQPLGFFFFFFFLSAAGKLLGKSQNRLVMPFTRLNHLPTPSPC